MAPLSDAPNEIINHILSFVSRSDLLNLCLANKSFRRCAEPLLYSTIVLSWEDNHVPKIVPLLCTLLQRPELFGHIHTVSMNGKGSPYEHVRSTLDQTSNVPWGQFRTAIEKTQVPYTELWVKNLESAKTCLEALLALFLANLSKTKRLTIERNFIAGHDLIGKVIQSKAFGKLPAFEQLEEISYLKGCCYRQTFGNDIFMDTISLFYLPATDIMVWVPNPPDFQWPAERPHLGHLTSLHIKRLSEQHLGEILSLTPNLKSLFWALEFDDIKKSSPTLDLDMVMAVISNVKATLTKLQIRLRIGGGQDPDYYPDMTVLGSFDGLHDFNQLTYLELPLVLLAGFGAEPRPLVDNIPTSVELLAISQDLIFDDSIGWERSYRNNRADILIEELIEALADDIPTRLPQVRQLSFLEDFEDLPILETMKFFQEKDEHSKGVFDIQLTSRYA